MPTEHSSESDRHKHGKTARRHGNGTRRRVSLADQVMKPLARTLRDANLKDPWEKVILASEQIIAGEWQVLESLGRMVAREFAEYSPIVNQAAERLSHQISQLVPSLNEAVQKLAAIESQLLDVTGIDANRPSRMTPPVAEQLQDLRVRITQWTSDAEMLRQFRRNRDVTQTVDAAVAALRFTVGAIAIVRIALAIMDRLNPKKVLEQALRPESI